MKKCKHMGDAFWSVETTGFWDAPGPHLHMIGKAPKNTPYLNITDANGNVLGSVCGKRDLKSLRRAIDKALGVRHD